MTTELVASRDRIADALFGMYREAEQRDRAALERRNWVAIPARTDESLRTQGLVVADRLLAAGVFREPPTQDALAALLHDQTAGHEWASRACVRAGSGCAKRFRRNADAVLALLAGPPQCAYCEAPIRENLEDDGPGWYDVLTRSEGGSDGYCASGPFHQHSPEKP